MRCERRRQGRVRRDGRIIQRTLKDSVEAMQLCAGETEVPAGGQSDETQVTIDRDKDGMWVVECPSVPGCVSQGQSTEEALEDVREAIALCIEVRAEQGRPLTLDTQRVEA